MVELPVEPPYGVIWHDLKAGKVIPFLGAGASLVGRTRLFNTDDLKDPIGLADKLRVSRDPLSQYLTEQLAPETKKLLEQPHRFNPPSDSILLQQALVGELNRLIQGGLLFDERRFEHISLAEETRRLIKQEPKGEELIRLNRFLLEDSYPNEIVKCQRKWNPFNPAFLPSGVELAHFLADDATFPSPDPHDRDDLAKVSSYYAISGRRRLRARLREVLNHEYKCGSLHQFLAAVPAPLVIVVTNYDTLVEEAFRAAGKPYDLVIYPTDRKDSRNAVLWWPHSANRPEVKAPNELAGDIDLARATVIYKMHGTIAREGSEWDSFVITEEDYVEFLSRMTNNTAIPPLFFPHFRERSFLFLGYSLRDWNLRVVLNNLSKHFSSRRMATSDEDEEALPSWAIQRSPSELERDLWRRRNVQIFDLTLDEFVGKMEERRRLDESQVGTRQR
jgi:hypothetical protein